MLSLPGAAVKRVIAVVAIQRVIARAAVDDVIVIAAAYGIIVAIAIDYIVYLRPRSKYHCRPTIEDIIFAVTIESVCARPAGQLINPIPPESRSA